MKFLLAFVLALALTSCATTEAYTGPDSLTPTVVDEPYRHVNSHNPRNVFWETHHVLVFKNPLYREVAFDVDCENNFFRVDVPARTVSRLLLTQDDGSCEVKRVR